MRQLIGSMLNPGPSSTPSLPEPQLQLQQPQSSLRQSNPPTNMMLWNYYSKIDKILKKNRLL
jgi:hypothetical protein